MAPTRYPWRGCVGVVPNPLPVWRLCWRGSKPATPVEVVLEWLLPATGGEVVPVCSGLLITMRQQRSVVTVVHRKRNVLLHTGSETSCLSDSPLIPNTVPALAGHETDGTDLLLILLQNDD